jgi:hypothetical protein
VGTVKLAAALPKEPGRNGLMAHASELLRRPGEQRIIVAVVDVRTIEDRKWEGMRIPVLGIHAAELLDEAGAEQARLLMERARDRRQGGNQLPFGERE